jgi:hypothetical protein
MIGCLMPVYKLDTYRQEAGVEPFELEVDDGRVITILPPSMEVAIQIGETPAFQQRELLKLLCGDSFDELWKAVADEQGSVAAKLVSDIAKHFKMGIGNVPGGFGA